MTDAQIIALLESTGHLRFPFGVPDSVPPVGNPGYPTRLDDPIVMAGIESYQSFMAPALEPLIAKHHPQRTSAAVRIDGVVGPAMQELFDQPRCEYPDYGLVGAAQAIGSGSWKSCHGIGDFHSASVRINRTNLPAFLEPLFDEVLTRVRKAYDEVGLRFHFDDRAPVQTEMSFVNSSDGWIGLAIVPGTALSCSASPIWLRLLATYRGGSTNEAIIQQWTSLIKHELGHNCGLSHSSGGVMNPSIVNGLPWSWKGDPSEGLLKSRFGGVPIPADPVPPTPPGPNPPLWNFTWPSNGFAQVDGKPIKITIGNKTGHILEAASV